MKKTILFKTITLDQNDGCDTPMTLNYYITYEPMYEAFQDPARYGIIIEKLANNCVPEKCEVGDLFYSGSDAHTFADMLVRCKVTPMSLRDTVEEYISGLIKIK